MNFEFSPVSICGNCQTIHAAGSLECCENPRIFSARVCSENGRDASLFVDLVSAGPAFPFRFFLLDTHGDLYLKKSYSAEDPPEKIKMIPIEKIVSDSLFAICATCGRTAKEKTIFEVFKGGRPGYNSLNFCGGSGGCGSANIALTGPNLPPVIFRDRVKSISVDQVSGVAYALTNSARIYKINATNSGIKISDDKGNEIFHNTTKREISRA